MKYGDYVEYKKEDLPQVNPQLHKSLTTFNEKSSTDIIPKNANDVNKNHSVPESHSVAIPFSDEFKADKRKRYAEGVVKKYGGSIDWARVEGYLKTIAEATENNDYHKAYKTAAKAAKYIAEKITAFFALYHKKKITVILYQDYCKNEIFALRQT